MAYVTPNSVIQLFEGINLDNRYMHTIYFASESAQNSWFTSKVSKTYQNHSYQRYGVNRVKVKDDATALMGCTYMRFMNSRTQSKWFYAFINHVEYVNENTAIITYEIDVMQTWFIQNGSVRPCMVLREHVNDDTLGHNLENEPVGSEQYELSFIKQTGYFDIYELVINSSAQPSSGADIMNNGLFNGTEYAVVDVETNPQQGVFTLNAMLGSWDKQQQSADILDMFTFPAKFCNVSTDLNKAQIEVPMVTGFGGYVPKNKKLFTYPYSFLHVTTKNGSAHDYHWEFFPNVLQTDPRFHIYGNPLGGGTIICYPDYYYGINNNHDEKLVMSDFPKNAFAYDAYQAWIANGGKTRLENEEEITTWRNVARGIKGGTEFATGTTGGVINTGVGASEVLDTGSISGLNRMTYGANQVANAASSMINSVADIVEAQNKINYQWNDASYRPNIPVGAASPNTSVSLRYLDFYFYHAHVRSEQARHIDDFFSCFGYAINKVKTPNLTGRAYWNFVQTKNCEIAGNMPSSSKAAIARIFDGGITFWHNGDNVGNYGISITEDSINNPIV